MAARQTKRAVPVLSRFARGATENTPRNEECCDGNAPSNDGSTVPGSVLATATLNGDPSVTVNSPALGTQHCADSENKSGPEGPLLLNALGVNLLPWFAPAVYQYCVAWCGTHLDAVLYATVVVGDIPVCRRGAFNGLASLHVTRVR